jgi:TonB family protein
MTTLIMPIIETIIKSSVILGFTFFAALLLRRQSAACRHTVWTAGLICALALPLFSLVLPAWQVEPIRAVQLSPGVIASQPMAAESGPVVIAAPAVAASTPSWLTTERALLLVWMIGVLSIASLLFREAVRLARVASGARTVEQPSWRELVREVSHALALTRRVRLMRNPNASVLGTWGTLRPRVLLPRESESWSDERLRVVLGHELAHVKRNDWLIQIIAETARAIYWFNPLFWIACTELRRESEHACDDAAMNLGGSLQMDGPTYAGHVLDLARTLKHSGQPAAAALAMASTSNLERRLIAMLNPSLNRRITGKGAAALIALVALALTIPLAAMSSQAPVQEVTVIHAAEFVSPAPPVAIPAAAASPRAVQRAIPKTVAVAAVARPTIEAAPVPPVQNPTATLSGTVSDPTGALIPGVPVSLTENSTGIVRRIMTNDSGSFTFSELPRGNYSGFAELPGFQRSAFSYLVAEPGTARLRITLGIAPLVTVVEIAPAAPLGIKCSDADCPPGPPTTPPSLDLPKPPTPELVSVNAPPATIPATRQDPIRVGGSIQTGRLQVHPVPAYPAEARSKGIEGVVTVVGLVGKDGQLRSLRIAGSTSPLLETSILDTLQNWRYVPTLINNEPTEVATVITLNFMLNR